MAKLYLKQGHDANGKQCYTVWKTVNSVRYYIGQELSRDCVLDLCEQSGVWQVIVTGAE